MSAEIESLAAQACAALVAKSSWFLPEALAVPVPDLCRPGLYAIHGDGEVWGELGLALPPAKRPLYVGKAESSAFGRLRDYHFKSGKTGWSTVRRSLAGLLRDSLGFQGMPRKPEKPDHFSNFGLSDKHEAKLSEWMQGHLTCAVWVRPRDSSKRLEDIEKDAKWSMKAPLNIDLRRGDPVTQWTEQVSNARKPLTQDARDWRP